MTNSATSKTWADGLRDAELTALWTARPTKSTSQIAIAMGLTRNQVIGRARRIKLPRHAGACVKGGKPANSGPRKSRAKPIFAPAKAVVVRMTLHGRCSWIEGNPNGLDTMFCGAQIERGAYCATHGALAYIATVRFTPAQLRAAKSLTLGDRPGKGRQT